MQKKYANLFEPIKIGNLEIKNRFAMAPMGPGGLCAEDGSFNEQGIEYYVQRAKGGTGLIITGVTYVENDIEKCAMPSMPCPTVNPTNFVKMAKVMTERVHAYDSKIFLQLTAGFGRVSIPGIVGDITPIAPSQIPHKWLDGVTCRELTIQEIKTYIQKFAESALIAKEAGFDGVEVHAVHEGYLLDQFAISFFNHRTDEYGGSLENRLRFATDIVKAIKEKCGAQFPVSLRYSVKSYIKGYNDGALPGEEFVEVGRDLEEGLRAAKILEEAGYDAFNADAGTYDSWYWNHPPMYFEKGMYLDLNKELKKAVKVPVITAGRMDNPELASRALDENMTDMVALGRPLLADSEIPNKIIQNKVNDIRPCLSCHDGCMGRLAHGGGLSCAVNPATGREKDFELKPALTSKKILIVGGGVAGCEVARVAAMRGHRVTLVESSSRLGGNLLPGGAPAFKEDDRALVRWYEKQLEDLKVCVQYNKKADKNDLLSTDADTIVIATGSTPKSLNIKAENTEVVFAEDILMNKVAAKDHAVIIGGGLVGAELALHLAQQDKNPVLVELMDDILSCGPAICHANSQMLIDLLKFHQVSVKTSSKVIEAKDHKVFIESNGKIESVDSNQIVLAVGYNANRSLYDDIKFDSNKETYLLGDAREVKNILAAIWDAYEVGRNL